jgi:signal transduction histidine kinase
LWRARAPISSGEIRRIERWLATARVALALALLVAIWIDPERGKYSLWAYGLLGFYISQGFFTMLLLRVRQRSTLAFRLLVHSGDIVWPALILLFVAGQVEPFFLFFVFVLTAAAYRWGLLETVGTAAAALILLWAESLAIHLHFVEWANHLLRQLNLPLVMVHAADFEPRNLFMRSIYLMVLGLLLGYLAEQQKQLRAEKAVIARILARVRVEAGLSGTLQEIIGDLLSMYGARHALVASQEIKSQHVFLGEVHSLKGATTLLQWLAPEFADRETYLYESNADTAYLGRSHRGMIYYALDHEGDTIRDTVPAALDNVAKKHTFDCLTTVSFQLAHEWWGRVFLLDPKLTGDIEDELRFLQELVRQIAPAVYNVYLIRRLRMRAGAVERARFARELHDGAVQSLIAVEMQLDVLKRQADSQPEVVSDELGRIQGLLREEVLKLRELMQQMKSLDVDSRKLLGFFHDTVERFQRETGIAARFVSEVGEVDMPQQTCRELARIVQEGLVNVRKHSQARHALVRLGSHDGKWQVVIEDDGRGFPFSGRLSHAELEVGRKGPVVIKERLRLIAGELTIESNPGRGSRLEINIPQNREVAYG